MRELFCMQWNNKRAVNEKAEQLLKIKICFFHFRAN